MATYLTPGVYYETVDLDSGAINPLRTDVVGFVGIAQKGPLHTAVAVTTWEQFQTVFGNFIATGYLAYTVHAFFQNGGSRCHVVRIASGTAFAQLDGAAVQPLDGHSSIVLDTTGFGPGAVVTVRRSSTYQVDHALQAVNAATRELVWQTPLESDLLGGALEFFTGPAAAAGVLLDSEGTPTLSVMALSPGVWGDQLSVEPAHSSSAATSTRKSTQPATGKALYVNSVAGFAAGTLVRVFQSLGGVATEAYRIITSVEPGLRILFWVDALPATIDRTAAISIESLEFALSVKLGGKVVELYAGLSLSPASSRYACAVINGASQQIQVLDLESIALAPLNLPDPGAANLAGGGLMLRGGRDGIAALQVLDFTGSSGQTEQRGLRALEDIDEVSIVAVPDILIRQSPPVAYTPPIVVQPDPCALCPSSPPPAGPLPPPLLEAAPTFSLEDIYYVQQALIDHCEALRYRIAVLDPPLFSGAGESRELQEIQTWRQRFDSKYAALYFPWVLVVDPLQLGGSPTRAIPPSGHVTGGYAQSDLTEGVHRAPANLSLSWAQALLVEVNSAEQGLLNPQGINCLRTFPGRGLRVYGARTLSSDFSWRYVSVRRLMMMIEKAVEYSLQWAVFEPNDAALRRGVTSSVTIFLESIFAGGGLAGATDKQAFFVRCDLSNNPPALAATGQFVAEVGVAPVVPAEFIVFRVGRTVDTLEVTE